MLDPLPGSGQEVFSPCPGQPTTCQGGLKPGFQKWAYENTYSFPGQCSDWVISASISHRNASISTIQNPTSTSLYLEARLNNLIGDNSSVQHSVDPIFIMCLNQPFVYNPGMVDAEGDSLVYELIPARIDANNSVTYLGTYSAIQPLSSVSGATLNSTTGDFTINPNLVETGVMVYRILEYRNSLLIGSIMFEGNIFTTPCPNQIPICYPQMGQQSFAVLPGPFCFNIYTYDPDTFDTLTISYQGIGIPGATFILSNDPNPVGTFCWDPDSADVRPQPYSFFITIEDNACPNHGVQVYAFDITVTFDSSIATFFPIETSFSGNVFYDLNQNGLKDTMEMDLPGQRIDISPDNASKFTDINGDFYFKSFLNSPQTLTVVPEPGWVVTTDSLSFTFGDDSLLHSGLDFGLAPVSNFNALKINLASGSPTCNSIEYYYLSYVNTGTENADGRIVLVIDSDTYFNSSNPSPDFVSGDTLIYNFTSLSTFQTGEIFIGIYLPFAGTPLDYNYSIELDSVGNFVEKDSGSLHQTVVCSFDPNDKAVSPEGLYSDHRVLSTDPLSYTIRFQNTGNDTAFTVFVQDYIDPSLDIQSLNLISSSHPMSTTIFPDRMVEFRFNNIHLPDSNVDEPGSNGFIQYEITPLQNLSLPVVVNNEANIYFDSNAPVVTNNVWNTLVSDLTVGVASIAADEDQILVIPNPIQHHAEIRFGKSFATMESQFRIFDAMGQLVENRTVNTSSIHISKGNLPPGIYFLELKNNNSRATGRFVIE